MTPLEQQMIDELIVTQGFTNDLAANLITQRVAASNTEGLDTLVPKVLEIVGTSPYEKWQEGFGVDWDSVIDNAQMTNSYKILHIYSKINSIRHVPEFSTSIEILIYNPTTDIYRTATVDANKNLFFEESDYFINNNDGLSYVCVIYAAETFGAYYFRTTLPVVYSNTKFCTDTYVSLINDTNSNSLYPFLRGVDCYNPIDLRIPACLEHLTVAVYQSSINIYAVNGSDTQVRVLKEFVENAPENTNFVLSAANLTQPTISDENLADWFYNDFFYNYYNLATYTGSGGGTIKNVRKFKINSNFLLGGRFYLQFIPNCIYLEGTFTESPANNTADAAGMHRGFQTSSYTLLQNFPMWTVLEGATTGCLLPRPQGSTAISDANFIFYSKNLERKYFCEFDENGTIIEDPEKYFICNLPVQQYVTGQSVRFVTNAFWSLFTANEISEIERYIGLKNWAIIWQ